VRERDDQEGIAVAWGVRGHLRSDHAARARPAVVHHHLLAEPFAQMGGDQPPDHVVAAAGWKRNDEADRLVGIVLSSDRRRERQQQAGSLEQRSMQCRHSRFLPGTRSHATAPL
jgi:hypothetical protein